MREKENLYQMALLRSFEERAAELYSQEKIRGFLHLYIGEEAIAVGTMRHLSEADCIVSTYREHGHAIARGIPLSSILLEMYGKREGCSGGRGGSMHLFDRSRNFFGGNAIVGGGMPLAVGVALASKMKKEKSLTACYIGDGSVAEGTFHESLNMAALWKLPLLFLCENNFYAMGTPISDHQSETNLSKKAASYNLPAQQIDGMDIEAVERATEEAVAAIRGGSGPYFLELETYRFRAHSMYDSDRYRDKKEVTAWKKRDPIKCYLATLKKRKIVSDKEFAAMMKRIEEEIDNAIDIAEKGTLEPVDHLMDDVYCEEGR